MQPVNPGQAVAGWVAAMVFWAMAGGVIWQLTHPDLGGQGAEVRHHFWTAAMFAWLLLDVGVIALFASRGNGLADHSIGGIVLLLAAPMLATSIASRLER